MDIKWNKTIIFTAMKPSLLERTATPLTADYIYIYMSVLGFGL